MVAVVAASFNCIEKKLDALCEIRRIIDAGCSMVKGPLLSLANLQDSFISFGIHIYGILDRTAVAQTFPPVESIFSLIKNRFCFSPPHSTVGLRSLIDNIRSKMFLEIFVAAV